MNRDVQFYDAFDAEFEDLQEGVQDELLAHTATGRVWSAIGQAEG